MLQPAPPTLPHSSAVPLCCPCPSPMNEHPPLLWSPSLFLQSNDYLLLCTQQYLNSCSLFCVATEMSPHPRSHFLKPNRPPQFYLPTMWPTSTHSSTLTSLRHFSYTSLIILFLRNQRFCQLFISSSAVKKFTHFCS